MGTVQCSIPVSILNGLSLLQTLRLSNVAIDEGQNQVLMLPRLHGLFLRRCSLSISTTYELIATLNEYSVYIEEIDIAYMHGEVDQYYRHKPAVDKELLYNRTLNLVHLSVSNCHLNAVLSDSIVALTRLRTLHLNNCILTGIPEILIKMRKMTAFTIYERIDRVSAYNT